MNSAQILARCAEEIFNIQGGDSESPWSASQFKKFSRALNIFIGEAWGEAPCEHSGETYSTQSGTYCNLCMRRVEVKNAEAANAGS